MIAPRETVVLETPRLILRPRRVDDADALFPSFADPDLMRYWSGPPHSSVDETRADFERHADDWRTWQISDHKPLWVRLNTHHAARYLATLAGS